MIVPPWVTALPINSVFINQAPWYIEQRVKTVFIYHTRSHP
eukprot:COSAG06_NODE_3365_length_5449_cov_2.510280_9_plen_41_part_00